MKHEILLVEDDATLRLVGASQFKLLGVKVDLAGNGIEAVEKAGNGYALIFMDLAMPEMNGFEATSRIRENELRLQQKRTPIVAMTAYSEREAALSVGMDDFIQKPVLLDTLRGIVQKWAPQALVKDETSG